MIEESKSFLCIGETYSGKLVLGIANEFNLNLWKGGSSRLELRFPKGLLLLPVRQNNQVVGHNVAFSPIHPIHSKQESMLFDMTGLEILGECNVGSGYEITGKDLPQEILRPYISMIKDWRMQISGLAVPTADDLANINKASPILNGPWGKRK